MKLHAEITESVLKCCYDIVNELGVGFVEAVYKNALVVALGEQSLNVEREKVFEVIFRKQRVGLYIADLVINGCVIIEVKSCAALLPVHQAQLINYLAASSCPIGLLVNFGSRRLDIKRLWHPSHLSRENDEVSPL